MSAFNISLHIIVPGKIYFPLTPLDCIKYFQFLINEVSEEIFNLLTEVRAILIRIEILISFTPFFSNIRIFMPIFRSYYFCFTRVFKNLIKLVLKNKRLLQTVLISLQDKTEVTKGT